jgi:methylmalonyl-CoA mutase N-terminal domain/subunit
METNITSVVDPLGGSYYLESLTNELEELAWDYLKKIEDQGGLVEAIESGWVHQQWRDGMEKQARLIGNGETSVIGLNCFQMDEEPYEVPVFRPDPDAAEVQSAKLEMLRKTRDNEKVKRSLDNLKEASQKGDNVMPAVIDAVKASATLGEICDVWREIYSIWSDPVMD